MRRNRVKGTKQNRKAFIDNGFCSLLVLVLQGIQRVQHLHCCRNNGVVLHAIQVISGLFESCVNFFSDFFIFMRQRSANNLNIFADNVLVLETESP